VTSVAIPAVWLFPADLQAGRRGITSHDNVSKAFGQSTHWDPGEGFNVQSYIRRVRKNLQEMGARIPVDRELKPDPPTLRQSDSGWQVKRAQRRLVFHGFHPGDVDGEFGANTERAVRAFQKARELDVDGVIGPFSWKLLKGQSGLKPLRRRSVAVLRSPD